MMQKVIVGVPKEVKQSEGRVGLTPNDVFDLSELGAKVLVERGAGCAARFLDEDYIRSGAVIVDEPGVLWEHSDIIVKVKEPVAGEYGFLADGRGKVLFCYLHLAGVDRTLTELLFQNSWTAIAYENVREGDTLPLLIPMSRIAGRQSMIGALKHNPSATQAVIIGCGIVGESALIEGLASGLAHISVFEAWETRRKALAEKYAQNDRIAIYPQETLSTKEGRSMLAAADIVISAPMLPGGKEAPIVLTARRHFRAMKRGAYIVDVSIDQGGSTEWTLGRPTKPGETFTCGKNNLVFSSTPNIPGSTVPREATLALTQATLPYVEYLVRFMLAWECGEHAALRHWFGFRSGLMTYRGMLVNHAVAQKHSFLGEQCYQPLDTFF